MLQASSLTVARRRAARRIVAAVLLVLCVDVAIAQQQGPIPGANVNVISGTGADGDWTLQRQNEPTIACSSRNPRHCLAGANDYRTVDIPFPSIGERITGDAWLGWYTTKDGGETWRTRLVPGYPQDTSAIGLASPLRGYPAGADPVVRAGTNGLFYYAGLVFDREEDGGSAIFVARFIDNNNQEGSAGDPIEYVGASIVQRLGPAPVVVARRDQRSAPRAVARARQRTAKPEIRAARVGAGVEQIGGTAQLVDKPWLAVDVPRAGAQACTIGGGTSGIPLQSFPGGRVYVAYTLFDGPGETRGRIMFSSSADCGNSWTPARVISRLPSADVNDDGVANTVDVSRVQASYNRTCGQTGYNPNADVNNDCRVDLLDLTLVSRGVGQPVPVQPRLSQGAALAIDPASGAVQIAWRQFNDGLRPDAIVTARATSGGTTISAPRVVSNLVSFDQGSSTTSFRTNGLPSIAFDGAGRAYLAWAGRGYANRVTPATEDDSRVVISTSLNGTAWTTPQQVDDSDQPGHQLMPAITFAQGKVQLIYYDLREDRSQLFQRFVDELGILAGAPPRIRHTIDVRAAQADPGDVPAFVSTRLTQYQFGGVPGTQTVQQLEFNPPNLPLFRAGTTPFMGDYVDVATEAPFVRSGTGWAFNTSATGSPVFHGIWTDNRDIRPPANGVWTDYTPPNPPFPRPLMSTFDPSQPVPPCVAGQAGMRNQNIYTARITTGLIVGALGNTRRLSAVQRSFPVFAQNNSAAVRSYRMTIANQPAGGQASFQQFGLLTTLDVEVPRRSTVARTVFVRSSDPRAQVNVTVVEITQPNGTVVANGQAGTIVLNPDPTNPDLENPDLENPDLENPDLENAEVHNPDLENATVRNPDLENPDLENPAIINPDLENTRVANPSILNPDLENPDLENPDLENPDLENPDLENADLINGALSDTTWTLKNKGNTAASFTVKLGLNRQFPTGFLSQLIAHKVYQTPTVVGCSLLKQTQTVLLANIPNPHYVTAAQFPNPDLENPDLENLTVALAPGETARITLRVFDPDRNDAITFSAAESVTPVAVAQAVGTVEAAQGATQPTVAAVLTPSAPVPGGTIGGTYTTTLPSTIPGSWTIAGGALPAGVTLNPATGVITGTPTAPGTYTFTARFQSTTGLTDYRTLTVTVGGVGAAADLSIAGSASVETITGNVLYTLTAANAGPAAAAVVLDDTLPEGTTFVSASTTQGSCRHANGALQCTLGTVSAGGSVGVQLRVRPRAAGRHVNHVSVSTAIADPNVANNAVDIATTTSVATPCTTVCFSGPTSFIAGPHDVEFGAITADFNEDGHPDIAFGPIDFNTVGIVLGNGTGGFGPSTPLAIPGEPDGADIADFNNDGHLDLLVTNREVAQAWLLFGTGTGGFSSPITITLPFGSESPAAADFNRDGNIDVALGTSSTGPRLAILLGNGNGTFQPPTLIGTTSGDASVITDDFNRDGNPDLAVASDNTVTILLGNGPAGFQAPVTFTLNAASGLLKTGDLNGDTYPDFVVGVATGLGGDGIPRLVASNGTGGFTAPAPVNLNASEIDESVAFADFDSDGDIDAVWNRVRGGVGIQLNDGTGVFGAPIYLSTPLTGQVIPGDFNADGRPDLVVTTGGTLQSQILAFLNTCDRPPADLAVTLTAPATTPVEDQSFTYTIGISNSGPNAATGVQLDFTFGSAADFVGIGGAPGSCTVDRQHVSCQFGTLASGGSLSLDVVVRARAGVNLPSIAGVTATTSDPNPANNTAFLTTLITPAASTLVVTNTNQSGPGSLWQAIADANDAGPRDTITFNIPGSGVHTIVASQLRDLPAINASVVIDGTTQPGYSGLPLIEISGAPGNQVNGLFLNAGNSIVRGLAINGFGGSGIFVNGGTAGGNVFEANAIGTNAAGTVAIPNQGYGIALNAPNNTVGGAALNAGNLISGNGLSGVGILSNGNTLLRNAIGTDITLTNALANASHGVFIQGSNNHVGSVATGVGNIIAFNTSAGVHVSSGTGNEIVSNAIYSNGALGIDLAPPGVNPNDAGDADTGANTRLNTPVLSSARTVGANTLVQVFLSPTPSGPFQVHFYANTACDASGSGEGQTGLGVSSFGANPGGDTNFEASFPTAQAPPGTFITATSTDSAGNTSEFSACAQVAADAGTANLSLTMVDTPDPVTVGSPLTYTIGVQNLGPNASSAATLTDVLPAGVTLVSANASAGSCSGTTTITCALGSIPNGALVTIGIVVTPASAGTLSNTATVSAAGTDPDNTNNSRTSTTVVQPAAPASFVVTNTSDSGAGSLRQAMLNANATPGADSITFNIPGAGPHSIALASQLPVVTEAVVIDATSEPDYAGTPVVQLVGTNAGVAANGIHITSGNSTVRGLAINRFSGSGIVLQSGGSNVITGNFIGTDVTGTTALANGTGISISSSNNTIGGSSAALRNVISGNTTGMSIQTGGSNIIEGNYIGIDAAGTGIVPNGAFAVSLLASQSNRIGGSASGAGNVIAGSSSINISLQGGSHNNQIQGNRIGTNAAGTAVLGTNQNGIYLIGSANNLIGGLTANAGNQIAGSVGSGQIVLGNGADNNTIQGNLIGLNAAGTGGLPTVTWGIQVQSAGNIIGGTAAGAGNVISGNNGGIVFFAAASGNSVLGNRIGTTADGVSPLPNTLYGIGIIGATGNTIGAPAAPNLIAFNDGAGISVPSGSQNAIRANNIRNNTALGIDLGTLGVTDNDPADTDTGANDLQNFPVLFGTNGGVQATLNSAPSSTFTIEFFANSVCDASGNGEGGTFLGAVTAITDAAGTVTTPLFAADVGQIITATATDASNNSSEFSSCVTVPEDASIAVTATDASAAELGNDTGTITITRSGPTTAQRDVTVNVSGSAANDGTDYAISSPFLLGDVFPAFFTLRFPIGQSTTTVTVTPIFSPNVEGSETVILTAEGSSATVTIADEPPVTLVATDATAAELGNDSGTITITRTGPTTYARDVVINVSGSAFNDGTDYTISSPLLSGPVFSGFFSLHFPAGQASTTATITPIFSPNVEGPETVIFTAEGGSATVTIADEPPVTLVATDDSAAEVGLDPGTVVVTRTGPTTYARDVVINRSGTAATDATDYTVTSPLLSGPVFSGFFTLHFPAGQSTTTVTITPIADAFAESPETVILTAEGATATVTIVDQFAPVSYTVTTTNDSGAGSLRQAILDANAHAGHDTITFAIPGAGVRTIFTAGLPVVTGPVTIDGATQTGFTGTPLIQLTGVEAPPGANGLVLDGGSSLVRALIINGFTGSGIVLQGGDDNVILGNWIGVASNGTSGAPNGVGISISSSGNVVGGLFPGAANVIAFNTASGVVVGASGFSNAITGNAIHHNGALGIDLNANGVTANDGGDADEGGNNLQNFPVLAPASGGVQGTLNTTPSGSFRIEFFSNATCDASGNGEGEVFLGSTTVTSDVTGLAPIPFFAIGSGQNVTATATDSANNTSEFSTCVTPASTSRTWISDASGFWEDPANWSDGIVPVDGDIVVIDRPATTPVVTVQSASVTLAGLRSEEPLVIAGGTLTFSGTATINGSLTMTGGLVTGSGNVVLNGATLWTGGNVGGTGSLVVGQTGQLFVNAPGFLGILPRPLINNGAVIWNQAGLSLTGAGQIVNATGALFEIQTNLTITNNTGGATSIQNAGLLFRSGAAGTVALEGVSFVNTGVLQLRLGTTSDRIVSNAPGTLGGVFNVALQPGFVPPIGSEYDVLAFSARTGTFDAINGNGQNYTASYSPTGLTLTAAATSIANLSITNTDAPDPVTVGSPLTYTITVSNAGPDTAMAVSMIDGISASSTFVSATPSQGSCLGTASITCSLGSIASGASATITIVVTPTTTGVLGNSAVVTSATQDNEPGNNFASATTTVTSPAATFVVTTTANSGAGSLRQAILDANAITGTVDLIHFNIPGEGVRTIAPTSFLPTITDPVIIDGRTQPGWNGAPLIELDGTNAGPTANGLFLTAGGSTVRGLLITRFGTGGQPADPGGAGIVIQGPGGNIVENNYIGVTADSFGSAPNRADGIFIDNSANNRIGPGANILSGNGRYGVMLNGAGTTGTIISGNLIGMDLEGTGPVPTNQIAGVGIFGASGTTIGGATPSLANSIGFNTGDGVLVASGTGNTVTRNRISFNGGLGINLGAAGVTANDPGDTDAGANDLLNFPVLTAVAGGVTGTFNGLPDASYLIEFFSSPACDASGNGEGGTFLGAVGIATDSGGNATIPFLATANQQITATTTDAAGNTSEFSSCVLVSPSLTISLPSTLPIGVGRSVTATVTLSTPAPAGGLVVAVSSDAPAIAVVAAPGTITFPQGTTTGTIGVSGVAVGSTTLRATAAGHLAGSLGITVTQNLISAPATLGVALGQTAQLPVSIGPSPAPPGGLTLDVVSADPSVVQVVTPQITVASGALSANATVRGLISGSANVTVSNAGYSPSTTAVTSSADLNILEPVVVFNTGLTAAPLTVRLEHQGAALAAQNPLVVSLSTSNAACVTVPPSVTIPAGLVSNTFQLSQGGTTSFPCTATVTASSSGLTSDTVSVTVNPAASFTPSGTPIVGSSLFTSSGFFLDATQHSGVSVTIASQNPSVLLVSGSATTAGAPSFTTTLTPNQTFITYYVHGLENVTGTVDVTISATAVNTGTQSVQVVQSGIEIANLTTATTTLSADDISPYVQVGLPCPGTTTFVCTVQSLRPGRPPLVATLSLSPGPTTIAQLKSDEPIATGQTVTKPIQPGIYYSQSIVPGTQFGIAVDPIAAGSVTLSVSAPGMITMTTSGVRTLTVTGPGITAPSSMIVGGGLQTPTGAQLGADQHGGVTVTVQSDDPTRVLVSPDGIAAGTVSFTRVLANGFTSVPYYVQGVENTIGEANVTISAPGFTSASHVVQVVGAGIEIANLTVNTTTLSADDTAFYLQVGLPCPTPSAVCTVQPVRAGGPTFVATVSLSPAGTPVAQLKSDQPPATGQSVTKPILPGFYYTQAAVTGTSFGLALDPLIAGSTTVTVTGPAGFTTMSATGSRTVTISGPTITPAVASLTVGASLQTPMSAFLDASEHGGINVTITSSDPSRVRVSPTTTTAGAASISIAVPNGQNSVVYHVQGMENVTGSATVTLSAPGFTSGNHSVQTVPSGIEVVNLDPTMTNLSGDDSDLYIQVGLPCAGNAQLCQVQNVRAGGPAFIATLSNSVDTVARLRSDEPATVGQNVTKPIQTGFYYTQAVVAGTSWGLAFDPLSNGSTTVTAAGPAGVLTMSTTGVRNITVTTPTFQLTNAEPVVGTGLQLSVPAFLTASEHGGTVVTVTSSLPSLVLVSDDTFTPGSGSRQVTIANGATFVPIVVQALENVTGTATVTLSAPGFASASMTVTVRQSAIEIQSLPTSIGASDANVMNWWVISGIPNETNAFMLQAQTVRAGTPGYVVTLTNGSPGVAQLGSDEPPATGQTVTKPIAPGSYFTLPAPGQPVYGLTFDPIAPGTTTVTATGIPGVISLPAATVTIVIHP